MKSHEMWKRIEEAKQAIRNELARLSADIGPEYAIELEIDWATSGSSDTGATHRNPSVDVAVSMKTMSGYQGWVASGASGNEFAAQPVAVSVYPR